MRLSSLRTIKQQNNRNRTATDGSFSCCSKRGKDALALLYIERINIDHTSRCLIRRRFVACSERRATREIGWMQPPNSQTESHASPPKTNASPS
mmetsp:Transcript_31553/g.60259  ORF Transcript_31553/g.60259 Transcript_31553/m.60259 type:complete len:94 (-) Transcript_31553:2140-2421(-)